MVWLHYSQQEKLSVKQNPRRLDFTSPIAYFQNEDSGIVRVSFSPLR